MARMRQHDSLPQDWRAISHDYPDVPGWYQRLPFDTAEEGRKTIEKRHTAVFNQIMRSMFDEE